VVNSYFAGNKKLAGTGTGARVEFADIDPSFLELSETKVARKTRASSATSTPSPAPRRRRSAPVSSRSLARDHARS
jgi:hypothetical protein